ncbi:NAD-dependent epimerase/dehydratase family protein [Paenibacillus sp. RC67]|uniref:polysaccharide biosynthesis C-terminal domain-containing protein n=1 Tax=Paenibacillus sp. RC67 TaxID=3039392 RepID=UPI0024AE6349|nr:NAD-dependent epimerase/dehydratase family protein [Paenibacillus sp. RC67]
MKTILVTGANGFIGRNLVATLERKEKVELLKFGSNQPIEQLREFASKADFVFHCAGVNRPNDVKEFSQGNTHFTNQLIAILKEDQRRTPILFTSSVQASLDNPYGNSKRNAEEAIFKYGKEADVDVYVYRLPNVFGKWCKPNYNSVIATWCYNITRDIPIEIHNPNNVLNLVYIDEIIEEFINAMIGNANMQTDGYCYIKRSFKVTLQALLDKIELFKTSRKTLVMGDLQDDFERYLYSTYLSYLPEDTFGYNLEMKHDNRGWLAEFIKSENFGQVFISRTKPGITRGNHWHHTKVEKFLVVEGDALIKFRPISGDNVLEYKVSGEQLKVIDIPPGYSHSITNTGQTELLTLFWANEIFDQQNPDTYFMEV